MCEALECPSDAMYRTVLMTVPEFPLSTINLCANHLRAAHQSGAVVVVSVSSLNEG